MCGITVEKNRKEEKILQRYTTVTQLLIEHEVLVPYSKGKCNRTRKK